MSDRLSALTNAGVSIWLDDLSRERLSTGSLAELVKTQDVRRVTTSLSIFAKAIGQPELYEGQVRDLAARGVEVGEALRTLTTFDVRAACDVLRPVYDATDGLDGRVSIEVDARLAHDKTATIAEAIALWWAVDRPNLFIKIPAAPARPAGDRRLPGRGHQHQCHPHLFPGTRRAGARRLSRRHGTRPRGRAGPLPAGFSRVILRVAGRHRGRRPTGQDRHSAGGRTAGPCRYSHARLAYRRYEQMLAGDGWPALAAAVARPQRPLWASTSTKDPAYPDTRYVVDLVAPGVVNSMPEHTLRAVADHGEIPEDSIHGTYARAQAVLDRLAGLGVDYDDVVEHLENDGIDGFDAAWRDLAGELQAALTNTAE